MTDRCSAQAEDVPECIDTLDSESEEDEIAEDASVMASCGDECPQSIAEDELLTPCMQLQQLHDSLRYVWYFCGTSTRGSRSWCREFQQRMQSENVDEEIPDEEVCPVGRAGAAWEGESDEARVQQDMADLHSAKAQRPSDVAYLT